MSNADRGTPERIPDFATITGFLDYWERIRGRTMRAAAVIPPEQIEWAPAAGRFTLGDLLRHLAAIERYMYAENARLSVSAYPGHGRELADGFEAVMKYMERLHDESVAIFSTLSDSDLLRKCQTPEGTSITTWKWLRAMVEHEVHHRGQIYTYLGLLGVPTPALFGLTSEEVKMRSRRVP
jgi:uncharacterized damage-inducible protein DinB